MDGRSYFGALSLIDRAHRSQDEASLGLISLLTPVIKGFLSDEGYKMTVKAQQVFGGYGYIEEAACHNSPAMPALR